MDISLASALSWVRQEQGGAAAPANEAEAKAAVAGAQSLIQSSLAQITEAAERAVLDAAARSAADTRKQAFYDTVYLVAAADGSVSPKERAKLAVGLRGMLGEGCDESAIEDGLDMARVLFDERGTQGAAKAIGEIITEPFERNSLLLIASTVAWLGGGVGTKEGLALQALAAAFSIPTKLLHEIMASAHHAAKA